MDSFAQRVVYGIFGAFLGALIAILTLFYVYEISWLFVGLAGTACFIVAFFLGEKAVLWLKEILSDIW